MDAATLNSTSEKHWYIIHCISGEENKVRDAIEQRIETMGMQDIIFDAFVPTQEQVQVMDGLPKRNESRVYLGYILIEMKLNEDSWNVIRSTPGVTGFVGIGEQPTPLLSKHVNQIMRGMRTWRCVKVTLEPGQLVKIIDGPYKDSVGSISIVDVERVKVGVVLSLLGHEIPVELDFWQVEKA